MFFFFVFVWVFQSALTSCPFGEYEALNDPVEAHYLVSGHFNDDNVRAAEAAGKAGISDEYKDLCMLNAVCDSENPYRTFDGSCNNLKKPWVGARDQCHRRILPALYQDNISKPLLQEDLWKIYNVLQSLPERSSVKRNQMFVSLLQFFVHDITDTPISEMEYYDCCSPQNENHEQCSMRINVTECCSYKAEKLDCMSFVRAARCPCSDTLTRQSMNKQSAYIDLSHVYLNGENRDKDKPWLLATTQSKFLKDLPALDPDCAFCWSDDGNCFKGDKRMNQQQGLSLIHVMFERLHNTVASELKSLNCGWDNEKVFQEARRICIARWQMVVLREIVPIMISERLLKEHNLHMKQLWHGSKVDSDAESVTYVESVHALFRGHSSVPQFVGGHEMKWLTSDGYFKSGNFLEENLAGQLRGAARYGFPMSDSVAEYMFSKDNIKPGMSMILINTQRGRDTGVPTFKTVLEWAYGREFDSFDSCMIHRTLSRKVVATLRRIYSTLDEVDLWVGAFIMQHFQSDQTSPLIFQKVHLKQLYGMVYGDRFFFTHEGVFCPEQLKELKRRSSFKQIICEAFPEISSVLKHPFEYSSHGGVWMKCDHFGKIDYSLWK